MRLDKLLEEMNFGSRKKVRRLILSKQVTIDGKVTLQENLNVDPQLQQIEVSGEALRVEGHVYYLLNKPAGIVSAVTDKHHATVLDVLHPEDCKAGLFPVGRLDRDTEGLVLLTNNGKLAHELLRPHKHIPKTYFVKVNGPVTEVHVATFQRGVIFHGDIHCKPAKLKILSVSPEESTLELTITEGKFHQVKKMFLTIGVKVTYLKRISMGPLHLPDDLATGAYRPLNQEELRALKKYFR